jgi:hypothetical protein
VSLHALRFFRGLVWDSLLRPYLSVGVWITASHGLAFIFEDLHVVNAIDRGEFLILRRPNVHYLAELLVTHLRQRQVVTWRETNHSTQTRLTRRN